MAHLISQSGRMQRAAPFVLPRTSYYSRTPYGALMRQGPTLRGLGQDGEAVDVQEGGTYNPPPPSTQVYYPSGGSGTGINWGNVITNLTGAATSAYNKYLQSDYQSQLLDRGLLLNSSGQLVSATGGTLNMSTLLLIGGGVLLVMMMAKK